MHFFHDRPKKIFCHVYFYDDCSLYTSVEKMIDLSDFHSVVSEITQSIGQQNISSFQK